MLSSSLNATRFAQKPLAQPSYNFAHVPSARRDLRGSCLQYVDNREAFHSCMAEMLLLCKEATRRRRRAEEEATNGAKTSAAAAVVSAAKPLSLEYLADRIDVDDPIFGFIVRTNEKEGTDLDPSVATTESTVAEAMELSSDSESGQQVDAAPTANAAANDDDDSKPEASRREAGAGDSSSSSSGSSNNQSNGATGDPSTHNDHWQRGMLQGFITCTTFTNYQKTFQWDSLNPVAFLFDDEHHPTPPRVGEAPGTSTESGSSSDEAADAIDQGSSDASAAAASPPLQERARDIDGTLAAEMQATVRCGDVWNEGIVWPRIAEISLLGGLKCGKALVSLVIEHLECMKASGRCNYDYVVLQATDNSISFYESMGFVRVGAVVKDENVGDERRQGSSSSCSGASSDDASAEPVPDDSPDKNDAVAELPNFVCSPTVPYTVGKGGDTPAEIAREANVDVWDIIFLNMATYPDIAPRSRLFPGTVLKVPAPSDPIKPNDGSKSRPSPQWYFAKENETPRMIAKQFEVNCIDLVEANRHRLDGLLSNSRLKEGTRIQVSHFDLAHEGEFKPYAHWSFPDDQFEEPEPSYMMARRLDRRKGGTAKLRVFEASLAVPITQFEPPTLLLPLSPAPTRFVDDRDHASDSAPEATRRGSGCSRRGSAASASHRDDPNAPVPPKRPPTSFMVFGSEVRETHKESIRGLAAIDIAKYVANLWNEMGPSQKVKYEKKAETYKRSYLQEKAAYQEELQSYMASSATTERAEPFEPAAVAAAEVTTAAADASCSRRPSMSSTSGASLFNKVVKLKPGAMTEGSEYTYWYVLTFIPDLRWCHLAPMIPVGTFGADKAKSQGRPKYKLVDESLGKEVDISSSFCIPIKSRSMKRTLDADKEEWDIIDDGTIDDSCDASVRAFARSVSRASYASYSQSSGPSDLPRRFTTCDRLPTLTATWKRREVSVRVLYGMDQARASGASSKKLSSFTSAKRKRGYDYLDDSPASLWSASDGSEYDEPPMKKRGRPTASISEKLLKRGPGRPRKDSHHSDAARAISFSAGPRGSSTSSLKPPPSHSFSQAAGFSSNPGSWSPTSSSPRSTARSRSQPPSSSRTSPGRAAALLSLGHHQLLHSPLVRVRSARPVVPDVVHFSEPPPPPMPVARSSRGRSLTPSNRVSPFVRFSDSSSLKPSSKPSSRNRSLNAEQSATKPKKPAPATRRSPVLSLKTSPTLDARWKAYALKLKAYREKHGSCRVPRFFPEDQSFANWVHNQRYSKTLTKERIDLLNEIGFEWLPLSVNAVRDPEPRGDSVSVSAVPSQNEPPAEKESSPSSGEETSDDAIMQTGTNVPKADDAIQEGPTEATTTESSQPDAAGPSSPTPSSPAGRRNRGAGRGRLAVLQLEPSQPVVSNDEASVSPPLGESRDGDVELSETQNDFEAQDGEKTSRRSKRQKWNSEEPPTDSFSIPAPDSTSLEVVPEASTCAPDSSRPDSSALSKDATEVIDTAPQGRSRTDKVERSPPPGRVTRRQPTIERDDGSDADDSSASCDSGSRHHFDSPVVRRSIRTQQGRPATQTVESPLPETPSASLRSPARKRHHPESVNENKSTKAKSPAKSPARKDGSHKGTMARELLSLLQNEPRKRRSVSVTGSRRSALQS